MIEASVFCWPLSSQSPVFLCCQLMCTSRSWPVGREREREREGSAFANFGTRRQIWPKCQEANNGSLREGCDETEERRPKRLQLTSDSRSCRYDTNHKTIWHYRLSVSLSVWLNIIFFFLSFWGALQLSRDTHTHTYTQLTLG